MIENCFMSANLKIFTGTFYVKSIDTINERNDYFSPERTERSFLRLQSYLSVVEEVRSDIDVATISLFN